MRIYNYRDMQPGETRKIIDNDDIQLILKIDAWKCKSKKVKFSEWEIWTFCGKHKVGSIVQRPIYTNRPSQTWIKCLNAAEIDVFANACEYFATKLNRYFPPWQDHVSFEFAEIPLSEGGKFKIDFDYFHLGLSTEKTPELLFFAKNVYIDWPYIPLNCNIACKKSL